MATQPSFNNQNIDFTRLAVLDAVTRPQPALVLYPQNTVGTTLSVNVSSTSVSIRYISSSIQTETITYVGKTIQEVATAINSLTLPIKAVPSITSTILKSNDIFAYNNSSYFAIPNDFKVFDRVPDNGIVIRSNKFTVKHNSIVNFKLLPPYGRTIFESWYPVITNAEFSYRENSKLYKFSIPEFNNQLWSLKYGRPFKDVIDGSLTYVRQNTFKVKRTPILWAGGNIKIYNNGNFIPESIIDDIDTENGLIYFKPNNIISDRTRIDYTYLEKNFEYTGIDLNCHITKNPQLLDKFVILYAKPYEGVNSPIVKQTIFHVIADSAEDAINKIQRSETKEPIIIIGGYNVQQIYTSDRINIIDTRSLGGGLLDLRGAKSPLYPTDSIIDNSQNVKIEDTVAEKQSFFDIGNYDGSAYPGAGAVIMEFPFSLKSKLSENDIKARASKFLGAGIIPLVSYYEEALPAVTGASSQISLLLNGGLLGSLNNVTGVCWSRSPIDLPGQVATGTWSTADDNLVPPISRYDSTGVITPTPSYGVYQYYLKSTPLAAIEYYYRDISISTTASTDERSYGPWTKVVIQDDREVPEGQLIKGSVSFPSSLNNKEYRSITVNSPFRLDSLGTFKDSVKQEIQAVSSAIQSRTTAINLTSPYYGTVVAQPVTKILSDIDNETFSLYQDSVGFSKAQEYLHSIVTTDMSGSYSGLYSYLANEVVESIYSITGRIKFFSTENLNYNDYTTNVYNLDVSNAIKNISILGGYRKNEYGTSDEVYKLITGKIFPIISGHHITDNKYLPAKYNYSMSGLYDIVISGVSHLIPEISGFSSAEISEINNNDYEYLYSAPNFISTSRLLSNLTGSMASELGPYYGSVWSGIATAVSRSDNAINSLRTSNGLPVVQHWYNPYNRYGKFAGSLSRQLIDCYEHLRYAQEHASTGVYWNGGYKLDVKTLATGYRYLETVLENAYDGFAETILRGGMLDSYTADLLYSYGWYVANKSSHVDFVNQYFDDNALLKDLSASFAGLLYSGLYTLIKGMTTYNGDMFETTIVDGNQGPFAISTPSKIIDTLAIACKVDSGYKPLAQAVFNTIKNNYGNNGFYYLDPLKSIPIAGHEDKIIEPLINLYNQL